MNLLAFYGGEKSNLLFGNEKNVCGNADLPQTTC